LNDDQLSVIEPNFKQSSNNNSQSYSETDNEDGSYSSYGGPSCPKAYEEIIQGLEADIRKHIRMEH
jgi:hypothetical protein